VLIVGQTPIWNPNLKEFLIGPKTSKKPPKTPRGGLFWGLEPLQNLRPFLKYEKKVAPLNFLGVKIGQI